MVFPDLVPRANVTLARRGVPVIGDREARLLEAVDRVRSIKDAAADAGISYGGPGGGATTLTDEGRRLLTAYQELRRRLEEDLSRAWEAPEEATELQA